MDLGTLLGRLRSEQGTAVDALHALGDIVLYTEVCAAAARFEVTPGEYIAASVGRFAAVADDAAWTSLVGAMARSDDPTGAALRRMLRWSLATDAAEPPSVAACRHEQGGGPCHDAP